MKAAILLIPFLLTLPLQAQLDLDGDTMSDIWAQLYRAQSPRPGDDDDQDGRSNHEESIAGTNPFSSSSCLELQLPTRVTTPLILSWRSITGKAYQLRSSSNLRTWTHIGSPVIGDGTTQTITVTPSQQGDFWSLAVSDIDQDRDGLTAYEERLLGYADNSPHSSAPVSGTDFTAALANFGSPAAFTFRGQSATGTPPTLAESSRFLQQATMGSSYATIQAVAASGIPAWIESQFLIPPTSHVATNNALSQSYFAADINETLTTSPYIWTWWDTAIGAPDLLRQRVAFALSEIFVVAETTELLQDNYWGIATYYDILVNNAFGNYRDLLYQISTNPAMGHFLSHVKNRPTDATNNIFPDENYAREIMQLFSIGLYELNQDGSRKKDAMGRDIPTYDNTDITNFARVFTGLTYNPRPPTNGSPYDGDAVNWAPITSAELYLDASDLWMATEMAQYEAMHETGSKNLLNGAITSGTLQQDLDAAIDNLFNHPNTGPFISRLLIQRLVTSNPSPDYIFRVAAAFNNNGSNVRGDMKAVIRAILLDPEARNRSQLSNPQFGKLREPALRHTQLIRAFNPTSSTGRFPAEQYEAREAYAQQPMSAPSVFNFYLPDHQPLGPIKDAGLTGPEFQITTATTSIKTMNFWSSIIQFEEYFTLDRDFFSTTQITFDYSAEIALADSAAELPALVDRLDILLTRGDLSAANRITILNALTSAFAAGNDPAEIVRFALYLFASSPDFAVLR
ncbi:MAG: DUF1800 family protein [Verrucomicrobiota bacterium]